MATPKQHIDEIRRTKFSIGGEVNPLTEDLHQAVKNLSAELYAKDVHFLMELIQNAEDNYYLDGVEPSLEFVITSRDITHTGALATLLIFNNEKGFSAKNIESICSVGRSTKKGNRKRGYIGEKGIGFKSVFLITAHPCIFSNGYKIRFNEDPCPHCNVGYIVPEWVEENPTLSEINQIYGSGSVLPTTTIVLPLKPDKVKPVKEQLSSIHPEVLLFLSKIKKLSIKEDSEDPRLNTVNAISISSETNFVTRKNIDAESYTLHLSAEENSNALDVKCIYYMWKQKFPVKQENRVERRMEVEELMITLAFPHGPRLHRGMSSPGVYAFLPTEMVTNLPFIIQADFLLASSRETIQSGNKWNQGILGCVSTAFINAFISLVKTTENAPVSSLPCMFRFLPVERSCPELNDVRESIRSKLVEENIVPCESYTEQKFFHKPCEVGRLMPAFWNILNEAREEGVSLHNLSSHGRYILSCSFDQKVYDPILNFLGVKHVAIGWYSKCIQSTNLVLGVSEDVYLELLLFLAENWCSSFQNSNVKNIPLLKYVGFDGFVSLCSISEATQQNGERNVLISHEFSHISWLIDCNKEFRCLADQFFMPKGTQEYLQLCYNKDKILHWLKDAAEIDVVSVYAYAKLILNALGCDHKLVVAFVHFLYHSLTKNYMSEGEVKYLCGRLPLQDNYGHVSIQRKGVLVPASGSKWVELIDSNPWREEGYIELGEVYLHPGYFAGVVTFKNQILEFLITYVGATDIPDLSPPNAEIPTELTKSNAFLLLDWIKNLIYKGVHMPQCFLRSIKEGCWLKTSLSGSPGYKPPSQSFMLTSSYGELLQNGSVFVDIPLIDVEFYGDKINKYKQELKAIGVMFEYGEACEFIGKHLMSLAAFFFLTKDNVFSMLNFIKFLREKFLSPVKFIQSIKEGKWMKTSLGYRSPVGSVLYDQEWKVASQISDIPFIDKDYYGVEIINFKMELKLLGVIVGFNQSDQLIVGFNQSYQLIADCLKRSSCLNSLTDEAVLLILECMHCLGSSEKLVKALKDANFLKTNIGYKSPSESFLCDPEWGSLLRVFNCFPLIDTHIYGSSILLYTNELRKLGVKVDFEEAVKAFTGVFRNKTSSIAKGNDLLFGKEKFLLFLDCYWKLKSTSRKFPDLKNCIREIKWLRTRLGDYRSPKECILFGPDWESIAPITLLPFIDDTEKYYGKGIHDYKKELKSMGVVIGIKEGVKFISTGLYLPADPHVITPANVLSLLECIRIIQQEQNGSLPDSFMKKIQKKWIKTYAGYRSPTESLLFDSKWGSFLQQNDGPFIDKEFYGSQIMTYGQELNEIGVIVDVEKGGQLLSNHLFVHSDFNTIVRIYNYLSAVKWEPSNEAAGRIWIPDGSDNGMWVSAGDCVLHDKDGLFGSRLNVLEKHYERKLLSFFSSSLEVKSNPSVDDYCKLWNVWESSGCPLSHGDCCAFWGYVTKHWSSKTERTLADSLEKLPVNSGLEETLLFNKHDVFIVDDLLLKDLFYQSSPHPIFVWYPQSSLPALPRTKLLEIYRKIGVRTISESVEKEEISIVDGVQLVQVNPSEVFIGKELVKLILGFLAGPSINMEAEKRQEAVKCLVNITVLVTVEPIAVGYSLPLSSGKVLSVRASRMIRWDREKSKFFMQKMDKAGGYRNMIEYGTYFSEVIADGVLWKNEELIYELSELIKLAFMVEFNEEAVGFLMKNKNLPVFAEDEEFLLSAFPSD